METIGLIGIILGLAVLCVLALKGVSLLVVGPLSAAIIVIFNGMGFEGLTTTYMGSVSGFVTNIFLYTLLGAAVGKYYEVSGAAKSVAGSIMHLVGADRSNSPMRIIVAMLIVSAVLTYGGVAVFAAVFALVPIAKEMFRRANLPWHLAMIPIACGMGTFTQSLLPGNPNMANILPTVYLGTKLTAMPLIGIVGSVIVIAVGLLYAKVQINKATARGEIFDLTLSAAQEDKAAPSVLVSYLPIIAMIAIVFIGSAVNLANVVYIALITTIILCVVLFWKYVPSQKAVAAGVAQSTLGPVLATSAVVGVGAVITNAPGFSIISGALANMGDSSPIFSMTVLTAVFSMITGAISGAIGIMMNNFVPAYIAAGISPDVIHRIVVLTASTFTAVPWCGAVCALMACAGLSHKEAYKHIAFVAIVGQGIALIVALIMVCI